MSKEMQGRLLQDYMELIGSLIIDQFNERYKEFDAERFKLEADERFVERDWVYRIGDFFKDLAYYETPCPSRGTQGHNDICIPSKDFIIEVKYARNFKSASGYRSSSTVWKQYQDDFDWLIKELEDKNKKGKRIFVILWCNSVESFGQIMQLGTGSGCLPTVNPAKIAFFPFLNCLPSSDGKVYTKDIKYNYEEKKYTVNLNTVGRTGKIDCIFLGRQEDRIHMALYF